MPVAPRKQPAKFDTMDRPENSDLGPADAVPAPDEIMDASGPASEAEFNASAPEELDATAASQRQLAAQQEKYLRLAAEYDNYRKRTARERAETYSRAQGDLVKQLLDALDDLSRFAHVDPAAVDASTVVQGVEMVEKKTLKSL